MQNYVFMTDSDSDLPLELKQQYDIPVVYMPYSLDGKEYFDDLGQSLNHKSFYDKMRAGSQPTTSALNETVYMEYFEPILSSGRDLLFAAFSSQLSATIQAIYAAREELLKQYRWPGNVRELRNICERIVVMSSSRTVDQSTLMDLHIFRELPPEPAGQPASPSESLPVMLPQVIRKKDLAKELGVSRTTLWRMSKRLEQQKEQQT